MLESLSEEGEAGRRRTPPWLTLLMVTKQQWRHKAANAFPHQMLLQLLVSAPAAAYLQLLRELFEELLPMSVETNRSLCRPSPSGDTNHAADLWPPLGVFCTEVLCLVEFLSLWETCVSLELRQAGRLSPVSPARDAGSLQSSHYCTFIWKSA